MIQDTTKKNIAIYGAGGLGREIACMIRHINEVDPHWNFIGFFDDGIEKSRQIDSFGRVLGGCNELNAWSTPISVVLCMGQPNTVATVFGKIRNSLVDFPNIISPDFKTADSTSFKIGMGNIITSGCSVTIGVTLGNFNLLNGSVVIGHDTSVGDFNVFMPATRISGAVTIGNRNMFGAMSFVKQCLKIGDDVTLSPLSPLLKDPKDGNLYIGNPAKILKY